MGGIVIDCHGHFTTEPEEFHAFRAAQVAGDGTAGGTTAGDESAGGYAGIGDEELVGIIAANQLRLQQERGTDVTLLSPRASGMGHHVPGQQRATAWARLSNDTIAQICRLFPQNFAAVAQLPQTIEGGLGAVIEEVERCADAGFVGVNVNPDPSGGRWESPPLTDPWWSPLWSTLERLELPAMVHVSGSCSPAVQTTGGHYLAADTIAFMQLLDGELFQRHPGLRLVIPHGGGAAPYHWGRFRGLALARGLDLETHLLGNLAFDTCVYHQPGIDLLLDVVPTATVLFGSELLGAVKADDPETGHPFDDTKRYLDAAGLDDDALDAVLGGNARRIYPRLDRLLASQGR